MLEFKNIVFNEDCLETIRKIPDNFVDYVITSPPYNLGEDIAHNSDKTKYHHGMDCMTQDEYFEFQKNVITGLLRITKRHIFYNIQILSKNKKAVFKIIGAFSEEIKEVIVWDKTYAEPAMGENIMNSVFELILVFSKEEPNKRRFNDVKFRGTVDNIFRNKKVVKTKTHLSQGHSAIMPLNIPRKILKIWGQQGDLVYDPFMGTGTTAVACISEKRLFIGSEIDLFYFNLCKKNIQNAMSKIEIPFDNHEETKEEKTEIENSGE